MNDLANEERETHLNMVADDREWWIVTTDDPVMAARFDKVAEGAPMGWGKTYRLHASQVRFYAMPNEAQLAKWTANLKVDKQPKVQTDQKVE